MAFHYSPKIVTDNILLYYDFSNQKTYQSGTISFDLSLNKVSADLVSVTVSNSSIPGYASFDGITSHIDCGNLDYLKFVDGDEFTLSAWIKVDSNLITTLSSIFQHGGNPASSTGYNLYVVNTGFVDFAKSNVANIGGSISTTYLDFDVWNHIVATIKYNGVNGIIKIYINGELRLTNNTWSANPDISDYTQSFYIGKSGVDSFFSYMYFPGLISSATVYGRALIDEEVLQNYNATKSRFGL